MAYETPTAADLTARYPAFAEVPEATIDVYIADAVGTAADSSWLEADYTPAIVAFAAHQMSLLGIGATSEVEGYARAGLTSVKSGDFQASFSGDVVKRASAGDLDATPYGRAYKLLLRKNKAGPRIAGGPVQLDAWGPLYRQNNGVIIP